MNDTTYDRPTMDEMLRAIAERAATQHTRLTANGTDFTYDRNGLRLGIAALEDELRELYDEWAAGKRKLDDPAVVAGIRHEVADIAAVAMLILRNVPVPALIGEPPPHEPMDVWDDREPS